MEPSRWLSERSEQGLSSLEGEEQKVDHAKRRVVGSAERLDQTFLSYQSDQRATRSP
jgi:hypothetical protein